MTLSRNDVTLQEITKDTVRVICNLSVDEAQSEFVAPNAISIAEAYFSENAWFRAVYCADTPVGFVMLDDQPEKPEYFLWRFMIASEYQGLGIGRRAIELVVEHVKTRPNAIEVITSVVQEEGGPEGFYRSLGFQLTGGFEDDEALMSLGF